MPAAIVDVSRTSYTATRASISIGCSNGAINAAAPPLAHPRLSAGAAVLRLVSSVAL
jgi:hypothetical protein